eukprot:14520549-Alexandrium_andersonii.AAC.1
MPQSDVKVRHQGRPRWGVFVAPLLAAGAAAGESLPSAACALGNPEMAKPGIPPPESPARRPRWKER